MKGKTALLTAIVFMVLFSANAFAAGCVGYNYYKDLTINHSLIDSNLTDFPVYTYINNTSNFDDITVPDVCFANTGNSQIYDYEVEKINSTDGYAWIEIPSVSSLADTTFRVYYGKVAAADLQDSKAVWNSTHMAVYHTNNSADDSVLAYNGTNNGVAWVSSQIGTGGDYEASETDDISFSTSPAISSDFSLSAWVKRESTGTEQFFMERRDGGSNNNYFWEFQAANTVKIGFYNGAAWQVFSTTTTFTDTTNYHHFAAVFDDTANKFLIYYDGAEDSNGSASGSPTTAGTQYLRIGARNANVYYLDGLMDEVRISNTAYSAAWIKAQYNSESDNLLTYGSEQSTPVNYPNVSMMTANETVFNNPIPTIQFNFTDLDNTTAACTLYFNGTNVSYNGAVNNNTATNMVVSPYKTNGAYWVWIDCNDSTGIGQSDNYSMTVNSSWIDSSNFNPAHPTEYVPNGSYQFNITVYDYFGTSGISAVNLTWNGTEETVTDDITINATHTIFRVNKTDLPPLNYTYAFMVLDNRSNVNWLNGTYTVNKSSNNTVTVSISPSTTIIVGTEATITCSDLRGATLSLYKDTVGVSNPYVATLSTGQYVFNCTATGLANYSNTNGSTILTVQSGGAGCSNNQTYAFAFSLNITNNTTVLDFQNQSGNTRSDLHDVYISNGSILSVNSSRYVVYNTTGLIGNVITFYWGNYLNNNTYTDGSGTPTATNNISGISEVNNYVRLTFMNEITLAEALAPNTTTYVDFFCSGGHQSITLANNSNITSLIAATYTNWSKITATMQYAPDDKYKRTIIIKSPVAERTLWIIDGQIDQIAEVVNELIDLTGGTYSAAQFTAKKWSGDTLRVVHEDYFDATDFAFFYGAVGDEYQYYISNGESTVNLGYIVIDTAALNKKIVMRGGISGTQEHLKNLTLEYTYDNTTGVIRFSYYDPYDNTTEVNLSVYTMADTLIYFAQVNNSNNVTFNYAVPNTTAKYKVLFMVEHHAYLGSLSWWGLIGAVIATGMVVGAGISAIYLQLGGMAAVIAPVILSTRKYVAFGMLISSILAISFTAMGILPFAMGGIAVLGILAYFWYLYSGIKKGERGE